MPVVDLSVPDAEQEAETEADPGSIVEAEEDREANQPEDRRTLTSSSSVS